LAIASIKGPGPGRGKTLDQNDPVFSTAARRNLTPDQMSLIRGRRYNRRTQVILLVSTNLKPLELLLRSEKRVMEEIDEVKVFQVPKMAT
jgi:hypothetical protein